LSGCAGFCLHFFHSFNVKAGKALMSILFLMAVNMGPLETGREVSDAVVMVVDLAG
jgi:hypothetical protein